MSLLLPLGLLQLQYLHPQFTTTTAPISHFVAQPHYVYHSPSVYTEHEISPRHDVAALELEGQFTRPRVFFDDDSLDDSREIRLEEQLREERLRQLQPPLGPPVREVRRYEKSVEGDLDYSEDKKIKLNRKRRDVDAATAHAPDTKQDAAEGVEERRGYRPTYLGSSRGSGVHSGHQIISPQTTTTWSGNGHRHGQDQRFPQATTTWGGNGHRQGVSQSQRFPQQRPAQQRPNPNVILKGQGLYGAYKGTFGGQKRKASGR